MYNFLIFAFLFFIGSILGWIIELIFRRFFASGNPERKWINPGFCMGPYLPLYGVGLCILYTIASLEKYFFTDNRVLSRAIVFFIMAVSMTVIEYFAGLMMLKWSKVRLWDYRDEWGNLQGIICPKFSLFWAILGAVYYFIIHPYIVDALMWFSDNLTFSFFIGLFFGVFIIDVCYSLQITVKIKKFAEENNVIVKYENLKYEIKRRYGRTKQKYHFFRPFHSDKALHEHLKDLKESFEIKTKRKSKRKGDL